MYELNVRQATKKTSTHWTPECLHLTCFSLLKGRGRLYSGCHIFAKYDKKATSQRSAFWLKNSVKREGHFSNTMICVITIENIQILPIKQGIQRRLSKCYFQTQFDWTIFFFLNCYIFTLLTVFNFLRCWSPGHGGEMCESQFIRPGCDCRREWMYWY